MGRRRFALLAVVLVAVNVFFWLAASGFALPGGGIVQNLLGTRLIRAEVVWSDGGKVQDTRLDRGVITTITTTAPATITLREKDGTTDAIPLATTVTVRVGATLGTLDQLKRGMRVVVSRPATGPADTIQVEGFGP